MNHTTVHTDSGEVIQDPQEALRLVEHQSDRVDRVFGVFSWAFCMIWGVAWLLAYGLLGAATWWNANSTPAWAFIVFALILAAAVVVSAVIGIRHRGGYRSQGRREASLNRQGVIYGWSWALSFGVGMSAIGVFIGRFELSNDAAAVLYNIVAPLIVGGLYISGSAIWRDLSQFVVGVWMLVLAFVSSFLTGVAGYLTLSVPAGGAMILLAVWALTLGHRHRSFAALMDGC